MTDKEQTCDVCGYSEYYTGVASCGLGPMSNSWCGLCLGMGASMRTVIDALIFGVGGINNVHPDVGLIYFDRDKDSYIDFRTKEVVPIKTQGGQEYEKRSDWLRNAMQGDGK